MVLKWFSQAATDAKLKCFERIRKVFCVRQNFAELRRPASKFKLMRNGRPTSKFKLKNGRPTSKFKLNRNETKAHFQTILDDLYIGMD
jgi:hypothetical protein